MTEVYAIIVFLFVLFALLGSSVWFVPMGVAWVGMELFTSRPAGDAMITTIWTGASSWTLTALPCLSGWVRSSIERACPRICFVALPHGCGFCRVACYIPISRDARFLWPYQPSSASTLNMVGKMSIPELRARISRTYDYRYIGGGCDPGVDDPTIADPDCLWRDH